MRIMPWSWNILPYMKNVDILQDPQAPPSKQWDAAWGNTIPKALSPVYGYNYTYLSQPFGASNRPGSSHYADQAPFFVRHRLKPVLFDPAMLRGNVEREYRP